ncbi:hypothetical protein E4U58_001347 [Claviceps cyperi]|nr:hypothetical protein E4U58_001347 [Claviceps cyperi]
MQLLSAIFVAIAAQGAVVNAREPGDHPPPPPFRWCNHGTGGNGGCEANGLHTYCCRTERTDYFDVQRKVTVVSQNSEGSTGCENGGLIFCS